jgi:hypothetical protein
LAGLGKRWRAPAAKRSHDGSCHLSRQLIVDRLRACRHKGPHWLDRWTKQTRRWSQ